MKKNYFLLAATTMMFAACAQSDLVNEIAEPQQQAISFETFANKQTRAENSSAAYSQNLEAHHESFNVWASKKVGSSYVDVYGNTVEKGEVTTTVTNNVTTWTASPLKYWDKAADSYEFYAAAPANDNWTATNTNSDGGYLAYNDFSLTGTNLANGTATTHDSWKGKTGDVDLMIADKCPIGALHYRDISNDIIPLGNVGNVNLNFNHILSRLNITVKTSFDNVIVKALNVERLKKTGSFNESTSVDDPATTDVVETLVSGTTKRWSTLNDVYTLAAYTGTGTDGLSLVKNADAVYTHEYLVIPQTVANTESTVNSGSAPDQDAYIYLEYTVGGELFKTYYGLAKVFNTSNLAFNEGWQNTLNITIAPDAITFDANAAVWVDNVTKNETIE